MDEEPSGSGSDDTDETHIPVRRAGLGMLLTTLLGAMLGVGLTLVAVQQSNVSGLSPSQGGSADSNAEDLESELGACTLETRSFYWIPTYAPSAQEAVRHSFLLANIERGDCPDGGSMPSLPFQPTEFLQGDNHVHFVHVDHKFSPSCDAETYKLSFHITHANSSSNNRTSFIMQVHRDLKLKVWRLLSCMPRPCDIQPGTAAAPQSMPPNGPAVADVAEFAAYELGFAMGRSGCLPNGTDGFNVSRVKRAVASVVDGLLWHLWLQLRDRADAEPRLVELTVLERCGEGARCIRQLSVPGGVCHAFEVSPASHERLLGERQGGAFAFDRTEVVSSHRQLVLQHPRELQEAARKPMTLRHILDGAVPASFDPRSHECFSRVVVYNQGHCADCYAAAMGQMIGIRKCLLDLGGYLAAGQAGPQRRLRLRQAGQEAAAAGDGKAEERRLDLSPTCADSPTWTITRKKDGRSFNCEWLAAHDPGCKKWPDHGQFSHCPATCDTCMKFHPWWENADYNYMPSMQDVAQCSRDAEGNARGCDGGSPTEVWNHWMRSLQRQLWVEGKDCMPYTMKCHDHGGITNPLYDKSHCDNLKGVFTWYQPCYCIPKSEFRSSPQCRAEAPSGSCAHDVPAALFEVKNVGHGLSSAETVLNMQRHILEFGPIYVSIEETKEFNDWDFGKKPVYTGGKTIIGGHAITTVGWGSLAGTDYWIIRNSWSDRWADKGHCKFQRGVNLDSIEERSVAASMPTSSFRDWSEPVCEFSYMRWQWWKSGDGTVTNYTGFADISCDKACDLDVFFSNRLESQDAAHSDGVKMPKKGVANAKTTFIVNLLQQGFGNIAGMLYIGIKATDSAGNVGKRHTTMSVPAAGS